MNFIALGGLIAILGLALALSENRRAINLKTVSLALLTQAAIAGLILYFPPGQAFLNAMVAGAQHVIDYGSLGAEFLFGELGKKETGFVIAFQVLPIIIFFSTLMSTLYYLGVMQRVIATLGGWLQKLVGVSKTEAMCAVANIFIGQTESPLVIKPYLKNLTQSELFAVMTGGLATIAGTVMAGYAALGVSLDYLITASFMAAPGGLLMAKIIKPETEQPVSRAGQAEFSDAEQPVNLFEAMGNGARDGLKLALNIGAMLVAFVAMIALLNGLIGGVAGLFGYEGLTLQGILGTLLAPLAWLLGVPWHEATTAGSLIGQKFVLNEFIAYVNFAEVKETLSPHTQIILTFALCGFANLTSIAILLGGLGSLAPERRQDVARMGLKAVLAGTLSNLMSAVLAGFFIALPL